MTPQERAHAIVRTVDHEWRSRRRRSHWRLNAEGITKRRGAQSSSQRNGAQQRTVSRLRCQIVRQKLAGQQALQVVGEQQGLRTVTAPIVVHHAALEAQVDELVVVRIVRRLTGRQAPQLQIQQWQQARVTTLREGIDHPDRALECARIGPSAS